MDDAVAIAASQRERAVDVQRAVVAAQLGEGIQVRIDDAPLELGRDARRQLLQRPGLHRPFPRPETAVSSARPRRAPAAAC